MPTDEYEIDAETIAETTLKALDCAATYYRRLARGAEKLEPKMEYHKTVKSLEHERSLLLRRWHKDPDEADWFCRGGEDAE